MPRRGSLRRNILLFGAAVVFLAGLIAFLAITRKPVLIMPPESEETLARRFAPENAYFTLQEALALLPKWPGPLIVPNSETPQFKVKYKPKRGSLGELLHIERPDDDPELVKFLEGCGPALEKAREALGKPYFLLPVRWADFEDWERGSMAGEFRGGWMPPLGVSWIGVAALSARRHPDVAPFCKGSCTMRKLPLQMGAPDVAPFCKGSCAIRKLPLQMGATAGEEAIRNLLDAIRFGRMMSSDGGRVYYGLGCSVQRDALMRVFDVCEGGSNETLRRLQAELERLRGELKAPTANLEFAWRVLDNTVRTEDTQARGSARLRRSILWGVQLKRAKTYFAEHSDALLQAIALPYPDFVNSEIMQQVRSSTPYQRADFFDFYSTMRELAKARTALEVSFHGAELVIALELYRRDHKEYPAGLDALAPDYIATVPLDAFSGKPLAYRRTDGDYFLYSMHDDTKRQGDEPRRRDIVIHRPPEVDETSSNP